MKEVVSVILRKECHVDGLIISNTTIDRPQLRSKQHTEEAGGLSGKPLTNKSTEMIREMYKMTKGVLRINCLYLNHNLVKLALDEFQIFY